MAAYFKRMCIWSAVVFLVVVFAVDMATSDIEGVHPPDIEPIRPFESLSSLSPSDGFPADEFPVAQVPPAQPEPALSPQNGAASPPSETVLESIASLVGQTVRGMAHESVKWVVAFAGELLD